MQFLLGMFGRLLLIQGAGLLTNAIAYATIIPVFLGTLNYALRTLDSFLISSPLLFQQAFYLSGLGHAISMLISAVTAGIYARLASPIFKGAAKAWVGWKIS